MKKINLAIGIVMVMVFAACSSIKVTSDTNKSDFSEYKTFKVVQFVNEEDLEAKKFPTNELNKKRVENAINSQATLKNLDESSDPDILLLWSVNVDLQRSYSTHTNYNGGGYMGYRGRYGGYGMGSSYSTTEVNDAIIGILSVAAIDAETEELLWLGTGQKEINRTSNKAEENINKVVAKIFEKFPN